MQPRRLALCLCIVLAALAFAAYPLISNSLHGRSSSQVITSYEAASKELLTAPELEAARAYNAALVPGVSDAFSSAALQQAARQYDGLLNIGGDGMMGYAEIPAIGITLPIFHGTDENALDRGIGHLLGSSLPVGGEDSHCVLTAHSGLAGQAMFTDLEQLQSGDLFYLHVLGQTLTYEVQAIRVVLPEDTTNLRIVPGADLCTLVTCTPYGVNTHRLLVQGSRVTPESAAVTETAAEETPRASTWQQQYCKGLLLGAAGVLLVAGIFFLIARKSRRRRPGTS